MIRFLLLLPFGVWSLAWEPVYSCSTSAAEIPIIHKIGNLLLGFAHHKSSAHPWSSTFRCREMSRSLPTACGLVDEGSCSVSCTVVVLRMDASGGRWSHVASEEQK
jgi:hypothetical protein